MSVTVRCATADDVGEILRLIQALADYEHEPDAVNATVPGLTASLFGPDPRVFAHVAELDGAIVGIAVWYVTFSTWTGRHGLYLEDLFVEERVRGRGVARRLFGALAREALARDCARIEWQVLGWNDPAKASYRALGGVPKPEWEPWRVDGAALAKLAEG